MSDYFHLVSGDGWKGLYRNGELVLEGHTIDVGDILDLFKCPMEVVYPDQSWLDDRGDLPKRFAEVKKESP